MNDSVIREPARSLKEQFSRSSEAWKEQSDPVFRFWAEGDWWGFPFFSLSASRYFGDKQTLKQTHCELPYLLMADDTMRDIRVFQVCDLFLHQFNRQSAHGIFQMCDLRCPDDRRSNRFLL
jgi:hypothetical protein